MKWWVSALMAVAVGWVAQAKPMTGSVSSWEGTFVVNPTNVAIRVAGKPPLTMWLYELGSESAGTAIGFSNETGDMILAPQPNATGVQPVYLHHAVTFATNGNAEVVVVYRVQGNGGQIYVEKYEYDGKGVALISKSLYGGRHEPVWRSEK